MSSSTPAPIRGLHGSIPDQPGCYLFRDADGRVLYVGKARNLRRRLTTYRNPRGPRAQSMLSQAVEVEWILLDDEQQALITERELIRQLRPRWNVKFRDDREYPHIRITDDPVPRILVERGPAGAGRTAGPYRSRRQAQQLLDLLLECRPVRSCDDRTFDDAARRGRACILAETGRCSAPCIGGVGAAEHRSDMDMVAAFLNGDSQDLLTRGRQRMLAAAAERRFETAARLRDLLAAAAAAAAAQPLVHDLGTAVDVWGLAEQPQQSCLTLLRIRNGRIVGHRSWTGEGLPEDMLEEGMRQQYGHGSDADRILCSISTTTRVRRTGARRHLPVETPQRGRLRRLVERAERQAGETLRREQALLREDRRAAAAEELSRICGGSISSIEGYDISHLNGRGTCGSQVRFVDGQPQPHASRVRNMREDRNDDPESMRELLRRRAARADSEPLPDLILVDGGPAQLAAAVEVLPPGTRILALAKEQEELWQPGRVQPLRLPRSSAGLQLLQQVRDEAHRTALRHQRRRRQQQLRSILEEVPGIGTARLTALRERFDGLGEIAAAPVEALQQAGLPRQVAIAAQQMARQHLAAADAEGTVREEKPDAEGDFSGKGEDAAAATRRTAGGRGLPAGT